MDSAILVPIAFFAAIAAVIILPSYFKSRERERMQDTLRAAIERGEPLPPELISAVTEGGRKFMTTRVQDFRKAAIWLAIAGALSVIGGVITWHEGVDTDTVIPFAFAAIPAFVGLVYLVFGFLNKDKK